jgi:hypothetical protein
VPLLNGRRSAVLLSNGDWSGFHGQCRDRDLPDFRCPFFLAVFGSLVSLWGADDGGLEESGVRGAGRGIRGFAERREESREDSLTLPSP